MVAAAVAVAAHGDDGAVEETTSLIRSRYLIYPNIEIILIGVIK